MDSHPVWDLPTRLFHWALVYAVLLCWVSHEEDYFQVHLWSGYAVLLLVCFRIVWGVVGSVHSRFADFVKGPGQVLRYVRGDLSPAAGHNPAGGWSILMMLSLLMVQAVTGLFNSDDLLYDGPLNHLLDSRWTDWLGGIHAWGFNVAAGFIGLHVAAVLFYQWGRGRDLIGPMLHGGRQGSERPVSNGRALVLLLVLTLLFAGALYLVPAPEPQWW